MATLPLAADSSADNPAPPTSTDSLPRHGCLSSPWAQVVRGSSPLPDKAVISSPSISPAGDGSGEGNGGNVGKKQVWNNPSNGVSSGGGEGGSVSSDQGCGVAASTAAVVVGGVSAWPALSESTRPPQKLLSPDASKSTHEGSVSGSQGHVTSHSQEVKQGSANANHNSGSHSVAQARQRPMRRGGGGGGGNRQGGFSRGPPAPPPPPAFLVPEMAQSNFSCVAPVLPPDSSLREPRPAGGLVPHPHATNYHSNHRSSSRRGNFGQHNRGDGRNNYRGVRRDREHGNHDWSSSQSPHLREVHEHPHIPPFRGFMRPHVQGSPQFAVPPAFRPYGNAMVYSDMPQLFYCPVPPDSYRGGMPYFPGPPPSPPYLVMPEPPLHVSIVKQIDYYFSDANLVKDEFLRSKMDKDGWVDINLIAKFPRVQKLTNNIPLILQCLRESSSVAEVEGDKVRRRDDYLKWISLNRFPPNADVQSPAYSTDDMLASNFQKASLEEAKQDRASSESVDESQVANGGSP